MKITELMQFIDFFKQVENAKKNTFLHWVKKYFKEPKEEILRDLINLETSPSYPKNFCSIKAINFEGVISNRELPLVLNFFKIKFRLPKKYELQLLDLDVNKYWIEKEMKIGDLNLCLISIE